MDLVVGSSTYLNHAGVFSKGQEVNVPVPVEELALGDVDGDGDLDLAVSVFTGLSPSFHCVELMQQGYLVMMRKGHPAAADFDLQQWLAYPHLMVSGRGQAYSSLDQKLAEMSLKRRVAMVVPSFLLIPDLVRHSELISLLPQRSLPANWQQDFVCFPPPVALESFPLHLACHVRRQHDPAVQLVSQLIRQIVKA